MLEPRSRTHWSSQVQLRRQRRKSYSMLRCTQSPGHPGGSEPGDFEVSINGRLQYSTFVCMHMPQATPTTRQVTTSPSMAHIVKPGSNHYLKMRWSNWMRTNSSDSEYAEWSASYPIWLSMESSSTLPPTFSLPYLSRRYSIMFQANISGPCRSRVTLKLPVQIAYQSKEAPSSPGELSPSCVPESALPFKRIGFVRDSTSLKLGRCLPRRAVHRNSMTQQWKFFPE
jgi:hypothetical protein